MNLIGELKKLDIDLSVDNDVFTFTFSDKTQKIVKIKDLDNYLLLCLINYIKI